MTKHVIIGGGPVATNAIETIRQFGGSESSITLVCDEIPHSRMALPYWLSGTVPREHTHTVDDAELSRLGGQLDHPLDDLDPPHRAPSRNRVPTPRAGKLDLAFI